MKRVYKYALPNSPGVSTTFDAPNNLAPLTVALQNNFPMLWAVAEVERSTVRWKAVGVMTGQAIDEFFESDDPAYLGTVVFDHPDKGFFPNGFVLHYFMEQL